jgi:hypothetical protein
VNGGGGREQPAHDVERRAQIGITPRSAPRW